MTPVPANCPSARRDRTILLLHRCLQPHFAEVKDPVKDRLKLYGLLEQLGPTRLHPTVGTAVDAYVAETGVAWREEDSEPNADPGGR